MAKTLSFTKTELMRAIRGNPDAPMLPPRTGDDALMADFRDDRRISSYGHIPTIAARLGCSDQTVRNYSQRRNKADEYTKLALAIQEALEQERQRGFAVREDFHVTLISDAKIALHSNVRLQDGPSIRFALERLDKEHYAVRSEMTGADGGNLFDDDARQALAELGQMLDDMGKDPSEAIRSAVNALKGKLAAIKNRGGSDDDYGSSELEDRFKAIQDSGEDNTPSTERDNEELS